MSSRVRGQEAFITFTTEGLGLLGGSFAKVKEFSATLRADLSETSYLGETYDDLDVQVHGWDFTFTVDEQDRETTNYLEQVLLREELHVKPAEVGMQVRIVYREPGILPVTYVFSDVVMKPNELGFSGRKEYVTTSFEGKAKRRTVI